MLRIKFSAGRQFSASKSASSPNAETLTVLQAANGKPLEIRNSKM
nr:hypothetical protein [uncultured Flavobacterium sp.]